MRCGLLELESDPVTCPHCGCEFEPKGTRTSRANRYYWGVCIALIAKHLGEHPEELHEALKAKFRGREDITTGLVIPRSTRSGSDDFWQYVDAVRHWAHTFLGLYIPSPNEPELS